MKVRAIIAASAASVSLFAFASADPAEAACNGTGNPWPTSAGWANEGPNAYTCDNLNDYNGYYNDTASDGWNVTVQTRWINGNSSWVSHGWVNTGGAISYADNNNFTNYKMCRGDGVCASVGSNSGF